MSQLPKLAEVNCKHKGFVQIVIAEVEDENIIVPFTIWESEDDYRAAIPDAMKLLATIDFSVQEGLTRSQGSDIGRDT